MPSQDRRGELVLLAEDGAADRDRLAERLRSAGLEVDLAANGVEAVAMAAQTPYDLILMDRHMPEMDGVEATQAIRLLPSYTKVPIVGLGGDASTKDRAVCLAVGMNDYLAKPAQADTLCSVLSQWLQMAPSCAKGSSA